MHDWQTKSIHYQLGNIGSEIGRALKWQQTAPQKAVAAAERALELIDWSLADRRNTAFLKELARIREVFADSFFGTNQYDQTQESWDRYFFPYALVANQRLPNASIEQ